MAGPGARPGGPPPTAKPDNRHFRDYPLTGRAANMPKSTKMTQSSLSKALARLISCLSVRLSQGLAQPLLLPLAPIQKKREPPEHPREYALGLGGRTIALRRTSSTIFHRTEKIAVQLGLSAMVGPCFSNVHVKRKILFDLLDRSGVKRMGPSRRFSMITSMQERRSPRWSRALTSAFAQMSMRPTG
jgi:hypothetical protein